ncbi:MAG TPA: oligoendopeptidase F, partial [Anaeromyxobacteraceae bacterium]|nr:oligoendopeptidase F [Anaeromyxobacteraceae bacterium]
DVPEKDRWNLADLYASEAAWSAARESLARRVPGLAAHRGHLGDSPQALAAALEEMHGLAADLGRLGFYAAALSDEDTRAARPLEMRQAAEQVAVQFAAATSWVRPEILALDPARVRAFVAEEPRLAPYRFYLEDVLRWRPHTLSPAEERIVAETGNLRSAGESAAAILVNADLPYPTVKLSSGQEVRMDPAAFALHRASRDRADRDRAFEAFFGALKGHSRTLGATLYAQTNAHVFSRKVLKFDSCLQAALFRNAIPTTVYTQLLADVHRNLPTLHRYLDLRRRMLGLPVLRYQDLYVPLVGSVDLRFTPEEAQAITLAAFAPLGKEYVGVLKRGYESRWTDFLPSTGKRAGAYSNGVYGVHPYQLLNFNGLYDDVSMLAHESGHSVHTALAHASQPHATSDYPTFVAEVASTLNENLLLHHMLDRARDDDTRLALLGSYLEHVRATLFRQAQFAEFELAFHEKVERGEPLTGENLGELYLRIARDHYGHGDGVVQVDDLVGAEWAFVAHFYLDFYVYQYATSLVASTALARGIREEAGTGSTARRDAYLAMLKAGGSQYPVDLLRAAGVDMTTSAPFDATIAEMNAVLDEQPVKAVPEEELAILARRAAARPGK